MSGTPVGRNIWPSASNIIPEFTNCKLAFCCSLGRDWYLVGSVGPDIPSGGCEFYDFFDSAELTTRAAIESKALKNL